MQTITTQYSVDDEIWFIDNDSNKILRGTIDKIYITATTRLDIVTATIKYLIKGGDGLFYAASEEMIAEDTLDLLDILQSTVDTSLCQ